MDIMTLAERIKYLRREAGDKRRYALQNFKRDDLKDAQAYEDEALGFELAANYLEVRLAAEEDHSDE